MGCLSSHILFALRFERIGFTSSKDWLCKSSDRNLHIFHKVFWVHPTEAKKLSRVDPTEATTWPDPPPLERNEVRGLWDSYYRGHRHLLQFMGTIIPKTRRWWSVLFWCCTNSMLHTFLGEFDTSRLWLIWTLLNIDSLKS